MKICWHVVNFIQTLGYEGKVRVCCFMRNNIIGKLSEQSFYDIYHGEKMQQIYHKLGGGAILIVMLIPALILQQEQ